MREQQFLAPEHLNHFQHSLIKGLNCNHLRRLTYDQMIHQLQQETGRVCVLFLDLSNGYGQTHRDLVTLQVAMAGNLKWAWNMQHGLYERLAVYVVTAIGLSLAYKVKGGVVQGGGMDPFFYIWNSLLLHAVYTHLVGVPLQLWQDTEELSLQAVVDDTTLWALSPPTMQRNVNVLVATLQWLNARCNPDKFGFLSFQQEKGVISHAPSTLHVEGSAVPSAPPSKYVKILGGNANILHGAQGDLVKLRKQARFVTVKLRQHPPSLSLLNAIVQGVLVARWLHTRLVHWPAGVELDTHTGEAGKVLGTVAHVMRKALHLPLKTPRKFFVDTKGLGLPPPLLSFWATILVDLYRAANARHRWVRHSTQISMLRAREVQSTTMGVHGSFANHSTDYDKLRSWCLTHEWDFCVRSPHDACDVWTVDLELPEVQGGVLLVVADTSGNSDGITWGMGYAVATLTGSIVAQGQAWLQACTASTELLEATAVVEAVRGVIECLKRHSSSVRLILAACDNKSAAEALCARALHHSVGSLRDRVVVDAIMLDCDFAVDYIWGPAEHDTGHAGVLAQVNKCADGLAKSAQEHRRGAHWVFPRAWSDGYTFHWTRRGIMVHAVKRAVKETLQVPASCPPSSQHAQPLPHITHTQEDQQSRAAWASAVFLHPQDQAQALLAAFYENTVDFYLMSEGEGQCASCGMHYWCRVRHHCIECPYIWHNVPEGLGNILTLARASLRHGVICHRVWGGLQFSMNGEHIVLQWLLARHAHTHIQLLKKRNFCLWPLHHASVPSQEVVQGLHRMCKRHARHFVMGVMHIVGRDMWYTKHPQLHSAPATAYWALSQSAQEALFLAQDHRQGVAAGGASHTPLHPSWLWHVLSSHPLLRAQASVQGQYRLANVGHVSWSAACRVGSTTGCNGKDLTVLRDMKEIHPHGALIVVKTPQHRQPQSVEFQRHRLRLGHTVEHAAWGHQAEWQRRSLTRVIEWLNAP